MAHPYKSAAHKNDPTWLRGLQPFVEKAVDADVKDVVRNYASDPVETARASYEPKEEE
jgi:uncharacterized lipoprotein YddW (UPF0748 family)